MYTLHSRRLGIFISLSLTFKNVRGGSFFFDMIRGSFQKFCTLYVFSLKMNLFYKIHLQAFTVIAIVIYHSGPTFG
jgi:hypothetical protein